MPLEFALDELYYYPPQSAPPGENRVGEDGMIDLAPLVRELSLLALPIKVLCRPDCLGLCQECGANLNDGDCGCDDERHRSASGNAGIIAKEQRQCQLNWSNANLYVLR